jgi:uncharacterized protein YfaS (alpha-2-macroglobulin family)
MGWIEAGGELDLAVKLARGLLDGRRQGRWNNTQENVFALLAMRRYYERYESVPPNFQARTWWSGRPLLQAKFDSYHQGRVSQKAPMDWLLGQPSGELTISKEGDGLLYYRVGLDYAPIEQNVSAKSRGFVVTRTYSGEGVEQIGPQRWTAKLGSMVTVSLVMEVPCERFHVALVCPRAAGLEPPDPTPGGRTRGRFYERSWTEHEQHRDDRSEAFCVCLAGGSHHWSFQVRATCAGEFRVPPARAEEMYHPECYGRTASEEFIIE